MSEVTILIVAFKPKEKLLNNIIDNFKFQYPILIVNNSMEKLSKTFYEIENVSIIDNIQNLGNGAGINLGIEKIETKYVLYLDIDAFIDNKNFKKLIDYANKIRNFAVLIPKLSNNENYLKITKIWNTEGSIMFFNMEKIKGIISFDEKFFLYFEELDFFFNCLKKGLDVFKVPEIEGKHDRGSSIDFKNNEEKVNQLRAWHYAWSQFYFNKKNFNIFKALNICIPFMLKDFFMMISYLIIFNFKKFWIRYNRISGFFHSILNLKSKKRI